MPENDLKLHYVIAKNNALLTSPLTCDKYCSPVSNFPPYSTHLHRKHSCLTLVTIVLLFKLYKKLYIYRYKYMFICSIVFTAMFFLILLYKEIKHI